MPNGVRAPWDSSQSLEERIALLLERVDHRNAGWDERDSREQMIAQARIDRLFVVPRSVRDGLRKADECVIAGIEADAAPLERPDRARRSRSVERISARASRGYDRISGGCEDSTDRMAIPGTVIEGHRYRSPIEDRSGM